MKRRNSPVLPSSRAFDKAFRGALSGALLASVWLAPEAAHAYCRTAACPTQKVAWQVCEPAVESDCGQALWWPNRCIGYTLQQDASVQVALPQAEEIFKTAFETWMAADCGGGTHPSFEMVYQGTVACDVHEYNKEKGNANVVLFKDEDWPYGSGGILALTTVTYHKETAQIYDADMELNSENVQSFTTGDTNVEFDLLSIAVHETGHFLGLAHSPEPDATMFVSYTKGTTELRDLSQDDVNAICAAFPPAFPISAECNAEPRHGFSSDCAVDQPEPDPETGQTGGCAMAYSDAKTRRGWVYAGAMLLALSWAVRRRKNRRP